MRRVITFVVLIICVVFSTALVGCNNRVDNEAIVRIHIRANSNSDDDQAVKLLVRDKVIGFIHDQISDCDTSAEVLDALENSLANIEEIADGVLLENGFSYGSRASIDYEYFPARDYDGVTFPSDYYNALILRLGTGTGDNWWCVAYPPLCFVGEDNPSGRIEYKSKLIEIINKYF